MEDDAIEKLKALQELQSKSQLEERVIILESIVSNLSNELAALKTSVSGDIQRLGNQNNNLNKQIQNTAHQIKGIAKPQ